MGTTINRLSAVDSIEGGDQFPIFDSGNGDARKASASLLKEFCNSDLDSTYKSQLTSVYATPSATGFTITVASGNTHLFLTPSAGFSAGTIKMPESPGDKDTVLVTSTQQVTTLTLDGNGATLSGEPSALAADGFFEMKYDASGNNWFRVG